MFFFLVGYLDSAVLHFEDGGRMTREKYDFFQRVLALPERKPDGSPFH